MLCACVFSHTLNFGRFFVSAPSLSLFHSWFLCVCTEYGGNLWSNITNHIQPGAIHGKAKECDNLTLSVEKCHEIVQFHNLFFFCERREVCKAVEVVPSYRRQTTQNWIYLASRTPVAKKRLKLVDNVIALLWLCFYWMGKFKRKGVTAYICYSFQRDTNTDIVQNDTMAAIRNSIAKNWHTQMETKCEIGLWLWWMYDIVITFMRENVYIKSPPWHRHVIHI